MQAHKTMHLKKSVENKILLLHNQLINQSITEWAVGLQFDNVNSEFASKWKFCSGLNAALRS